MEELKCPNCGAPLPYDGRTAVVKCEYCGQPVRVMQEWNTAQPFNVSVVVQSPPAVEVTHSRIEMMEQAPPRQRASSCGCITTLLILFALGVGIYAFLLSVVPGIPGIPSIPGFPDIAGFEESGFAKEVLTFGGTGTGAGLFKDPLGIAVDGGGNVYVADSKPVRVQKFDSEGNFLNLWTTGYSYIHDMAADRAGNVYVVAVGGEIVKYDGSTGAELGRFEYDWRAQDGDFGFFGYGRVATLADGRLLALMYLQPAWTYLDADGNLGEHASGLLNGVAEESWANVEMAVDGLGTVYILGAANDTVYKFNPEGRYQNRFGSEGDGEDQFDVSAEAIAVDRQSRVYVSDWSGVQVYDGNGRHIDRIGESRTGIARHLAISEADELYAIVDTTVVKYDLTPDE